ncbi:cyclic GMP-AMP synthase [Cololabis saira]|uniref:cyclic GMP-AMP synthase n=1 Tax=Cololabis saira TaxID=129043 RepID=UPI002AD3AEDE|nr:cyclic GMP-AMP synthase [Cololabis saira]
MDGEHGSPLQPKPVRRRQKAQQEDPGEARKSPPAAERSEVVSPGLADWIKRRANHLKIRQTDRCWAAEVVNDFRENLLKFLRSEQPLFQGADFLTAGSYFEKVKIQSPDEFDMMLTVQLPCGLNTTRLDGGLFYRLDLARPTRRPIQPFLLEGSLTISSSKVLSEMHGLVRKFLKAYRVPDHQCHWEVNRKRLLSPAVTLSLRSTERSAELISVDVVFALEVQGWPAAVRNGPDVENWLGKKVRQEIRSLPCYFVPKRLKGQKGNEDAKESWRISFSHIEKKIIMFHGNKKTCCESKATKCCRKSCLMLLKSLIQGLKHCFPKELEDLCSYHGKTAFLHCLSSRFDDAAWAPQNLPACFLYLADALENHARTGILPHFFIPECNLFSSPSFSRKSLVFLVGVLEEQRREGLPLLKPPAPVSPLRPTVTAAQPASGSLSEPPLTPRPPVTFILVLLFLLVVILGLIWYFFKR